jgi:hypothetical protein
MLTFELDALFFESLIIIDLIWREMLNTGSGTVFCDDGAAGASALLPLSN